MLASRLIVDLAGAELTGSADVHSGLPERPVVRLRPERTRRGSSGSRSTRASSARSSSGSGSRSTRRLGRHRPDLARPRRDARDRPRRGGRPRRARPRAAHDAAAALRRRPPDARPAAAAPRRGRARRAPASARRTRGASSPPIPIPAAIRLPDPMSGDQAILRTTLLDGLIAAAAENVDAGNDDIALFELARVYLPSGGELPEERWRVGGIVDGGFEAARGAVEVLHDALHLELQPERDDAAVPPSRARRPRPPAGWLGELHPALLDGAWGVFELDLVELTAPIPERILYDDVITFPPLRQDIAVVVAEEVEAAALVDRGARGRGARAARGARLRRLPRRPGRRGPQVGRDPPLAAGARPDALGRRRRRRAGARRRGAGRALRRRAARASPRQSDRRNAA